MLIFSMRFGLIPPGNKGKGYDAAYHNLRALNKELVQEAASSYITQFAGQNEIAMATARYRFDGVYAAL